MTVLAVGVVTDRVVAEGDDRVVEAGGVADGQGGGAGEGVLALDGAVALGEERRVDDREDDAAAVEQRQRGGAHGEAVPAARMSSAPTFGWT
ncbi:MAG TPA: hypothetical protein VLW50_27270 [Streptosporangiaceae bacterium]|nr:hypothetical protein [Streptosporangiaceae bacterium]